MPAVHAEPLLAAVAPVRAQNLMQAKERRGVRGVSRAGDVEVPGAAEVVLGAGAADRRELLVTVQVELDLALAPPARPVHAPGDIRADVLPGAGDPVHDRVRRAGGERVAAVELGVQVAGAG